MSNLLDSDPDYILAPRFGNSLKKLLNRYPEGCPFKVSGPALGLSEEEMEEEYQRIVLKLRSLMGVEE